jgi:hypothetical protein
MPILWRDNDGVRPHHHHHHRSLGEDLATLLGAVLLIGGTVLILGGLTIW